MNRAIVKLNMCFDAYKFQGKIWYENHLGKSIVSRWDAEKNQKVKLLFKSTKEDSLTIRH